jgi:hypothetical protein
MNGVSVPSTCGIDPGPSRSAGAEGKHQRLLLTKNVTIMNTYQIDGFEFVAERMVEGILVNPEIPVYFNDEQRVQWFERPYIELWRSAWVFCVDNPSTGVATNCGTFHNIDEALEFIREKWPETREDNDDGQEMR